MPSSTCSTSTASRTPRPQRSSGETGDDGFVGFTVALGLFDGLGRMRLALGLDDDTPDGDGPVLVPTPRSDIPAH